MTQRNGFKLTDLQLHDGGGCSARVVLAADAFYFHGHFPAHPVLPAAAHVELFRTLVEQATGSRWRIAVLAAAKFTRVLEPGVTVLLHVHTRPAATASQLDVRGHSTVDDQPAATLNLTLAPRS